MLSLLSDKLLGMVRRRDISNDNCFASLTHFLVVKSSWSNLFHVTASC
jgi:hypothetical protein